LTINHVLYNIADWKDIFYNDNDRSDFIDRLAVLAEEGAMDVYAWALMPNYFHLARPS